MMFTLKRIAQGFADTAYHDIPVDANIPIDEDAIARMIRDNARRFSGIENGTVRIVDIDMTNDRKQFWSKVMVVGSDQLPTFFAYYYGEPTEAQLPEETFLSVDHPDRMP